MNKILILLLLLSFHSYGQQPECDENGNPILQLANDLSLPNCLNPKYLDPAVKENDPSSLCGDCKTRFQGRLDKTIGTYSKAEKQKQFLDAAFNEYQKNITENLIDSLKLRALKPTGSSFSKSIKSCKMKVTSDFVTGCKSKFVTEYFKNGKVLNDFNESISTELAKILSDKPGFNPGNSLLKRNSPACFIPEKDILYLTVSAMEESLTPELIKSISSLDPAKFSSIEELLMEESITNHYQGDISELLDSLKSHPLIAEKFKTPGNMVSFFKSISDPKALKQLHDQIYNTKNGEEFDTKLAAKCDASFKSLKDSICSEDFESGKINLNPFANYNKIFSKELKPSSEDLATSEELENRNIDVLKLCEESIPKNSLNLSKANQSISAGMNPQYSDHTFSQYKTEKHEKDIGQANMNMCLNRERNCSENTFSCKLIQKFKSYQDPKSVDFKLANSSNKEVNELLRSMIGDTSKIDSKTKDILVSQGIIPKDDGTIVQQPDIPERQPDVTANQQQAQGATIANTKVAPSSVSNSASNNRTPASNNNFSEEGYSNVNTAASSNTLPDFSDLMDDQQELRGIQDEIKRRLLGMPENRPANLNDAKRIARESFKSRGRRISPEEETAFASRMMERPEAPVPQTADSTFQNTPANSDNRAAVSGGESANSKWRKGQDQAALMGMQGAQSALGKESANTPAAADNKPKDMTKVALNIADDPQVTLSDMFNKKIDQNDPETQLLKVLLRNKNNFLLQIKSMNFKIVFDGNNFNLLLESGDRQEAARIRPQLEMFLKKLKK